jgi:hypothetical protein
MTEKAAKSLATALGGDAEYPMPQSRSWGVTLERPDGRFVSIEDGVGWLYRDRKGYDAYQETGDDEPLVDSQEWSSWGVTEEWSRAFAALLGAEDYQSGGNIWVVLYQRPDGRFVVIGVDGADLYRSAEHYDRYYEGGQPEPDHVYWDEGIVS